MQNDHLISTDDFCSHYQVSYSFITSLQEQGLIRLQSAENVQFIDIDELQKLEQLVRMHYDLAINIEGIDAIFNLLQKVNAMQDEIVYLKNKLRNYENS